MLELGAVTAGEPAVLELGAVTAGAGGLGLARRRLARGLRWMGGGYGWGWPVGLGVGLAARSTYPIMGRVIGGLLWWLSRLLRRLRLVKTENAPPAAESSLSGPVWSFYRLIGR